MNIKTPKRLLFLSLALIVAMPTLFLGTMLWQEAQKEYARKALIMAIRNEDTEAALSALQHGSDPNSRELPADRVGIVQRFRDYLTGHRQKDHGRSALALALEKRNRTVTMELVRRGVRESSDFIGVPVIYVALQNQWEDVAQELLKRGVAESDSDVLMIAVQFGDSRIVKQLVEGGVPIGPFTQGSLALSLALRVRHPEIAAYLIAHGAPVHNPNPLGDTALMAAAQQGDDASVRMLLRHGAPANYVGAYGTALTCAAVRGHLTTMKILVAAGADVHAGGYYRKMLERVNQRGYTEIAAYLQRWGDGE